MLCLAYIHFMKNDFDKVNDLLKSYDDGDLSFLCKLYGIGKIQLDNKRHFLSLERQGEIVCSLVSLKTYIIQCYENVVI